LKQIEKKLKALHSQKKEITTREKQCQQKEYEARLIQIGTVSEKYFNLQKVHPAHFEHFLKIFLTSKNIDKYITPAWQQVQRMSQQAKNPQ